jgi:hypothetical protein
MWFVTSLAIIFVYHKHENSYFTDNLIGGLSLNTALHV